MKFVKHCVLGLFLALSTLTARAEDLQLAAYFEVEKVLKTYIEGIRTGDVEMLKSIFDDNAGLHGYIMGNYVNGALSTFLNDVAQRPAPAKSGEPFRATVVEIEVNENIARGTVIEESYFGLNFKDHFHLLKTPNGWRIVDKIFYHEPPPNRPAN